MTTKNKRRIGKKAEECIRAYHGVGDDTDVLGSYTGVCRTDQPCGAPLFAPYGTVIYPDDLKPIQDADDL